MKKKRFSEEQITYALRQVEAGTPPADVCRQPRVQLSELLHLEKALRQPGPHRGEGAAAAARREHTPEAPGRRSHARQAHPGGGGAKKALKPTRLEGLQLRMRIRRRKHMCLHRGVPPQAQRTHERWSMDFVHDQLFDGRPFRMLTLIDQFGRQSPLIEPRFGFSGRDVTDALDRLVEHTGAPASITIDHGTEFTSKALEEWAYRRGVKLDFHASRKTHRERTHRVVQWSTAGRVFEHQPVHVAR
jgi:transposase InsO family protein